MSGAIRCSKTFCLNAVGNCISVTIGKNVDHQCSDLTDTTNDKLECFATTYCLN